VEEEASARCPTGLIDLMDTACNHLIIHLPVPLHSMAPSLAQAVEDYLGVEDAEESLVAGEGSVVGGDKS
jgi:hypothetical protein